MKAPLPPLLSNDTTPAFDYGDKVELRKLLLARGVSEEVLASGGIGKKAREAKVTPGATRRSPVAWWAPWVLSGAPAR